jgi:hypothetical protein
MQPWNLKTPPENGSSSSRRELLSTPERRVDVIGLARNEKVGEAASIGLRRLVVRESRGSQA